MMQSCSMLDCLWIVSRKGHEIDMARSTSVPVTYSNAHEIDYGISDALLAMIQHAKHVGGRRLCSCKLINFVISNNELLSGLGKKAVIVI